MTLVHLPFYLGQDEKRDTKIAPLGVLKLLENGRLDRDGRIIKRPGFSVGSLTHNDGTTIGTVQTVAARGDERVLVGDNTVNAWSPTLSRWRDWNKLPRVGVPERHAGARNKEGDSASPSIAYASGYACVVYENPTAAGSSYLHATIYDVASWSVRSEAILELTQGKCARVIAVGTTLVALWFKSSTTELKFSTFDLSSPAATWSAPVALQNDLAGVVGQYDAIPWSTGFAYIYSDNAAQTHCVYADLTGATLASVLFGIQGPCAFYAVSGEATTIAINTAGGNIRVVSFPASGGSPFGGAQVGPTLVETNINNQGYPVVARKNSTIRTVGWSRLDAGAGVAFPELTSFCEVTAATNALSSFTLRPYVLLASKALYVSGRIYFWGVTKSTYDRTLFLLAHTQFSAAAEGTDETVETSMARGAARAWVTDRAHPDLLTYVDANGDTQLLTTFHFLQAGSVASANPFTAIDIATIPFGGTERLQTAQYGGLLYLSGGLLSVFDGEGAHELGFLMAPRIILLTPAAGGSMTASSTYRYLMTVETYDAQGGHHISQVSDVYSVNLGVGQTQVTIDYHAGLLSNRRRMWNEAAPNAERSSTRLFFWRTAANGQLFQRITGDDGVDGLPYPSPPGTAIVDQMSDATLTATSNPFVYTQGQRGALSGPLQHEPPPPCKYLAFGKARAIVGGLEQPDEVRFSKFFFPGEPVEWSEDFAFRRRVQGKVTAVAYLDDAAIVWTKDAVFAVFGEGPDDSGAGSFADPVVVPSEAGCIDWRSVVLTPLGLFFQGRSDRLYLLPRGLSSPVWIGEPVRDTLAANPKITGAVLQAEKGLVVFMCCNPAANTSRTLVYDLRSQQWSVDKIGDGTVFSGNAARLAVWGGLLVYAADGGYYVESATYSDAGVWYGVTIETQALRPHGLQADGRTRKLAVLGEARVLLQDVDLAIATDDAQAFTAGPLFSISSAGTGDPFRVEWRLPTQKFGSVRVRIRERQNGASLNEAFRFNGLTLDTHPRPGMPRLSESRRG